MKVHATRTARYKCCMQTCRHNTEYRITVRLFRFTGSKLSGYPSLALMCDYNSCTKVARRPRLYYYMKIRTLLFSHNRVNTAENKLFIKIYIYVNAQFETRYIIFILLFYSRCGLFAAY